MIVNTNWTFSQTMQGKQITEDVEQAPSSKKLLRAKVGSLVAVLPFLRKQKKQINLNLCVNPADRLQGVVE